MDLRDKGSSRLQPYQWSLADRKGPSARPGRIPILVPAPQLGNDLVGSQLLLPVQQRGLNNEGDRQASQRVRDIPISAVEQQVIALQKYPALLPLILLCLLDSLIFLIILLMEQLFKKHNSHCKFMDYYK